MSKKQGLSDMVREALGRRWELRRKDLGADAHLTKSGFVFDTEVWELPGLGQVCFMKMSAVLGLMKMETAVLSVSGKDTPLFNLDWVRAMGKETQIAELYDTQLSPWPAEKQAEFDALRERDADLPDMSSTGKWYDAILYPCSYHKAGKRLTERLAAAAREYTETYLWQLAEAPACDAAAKRGKTRAFAERLFAEGGPAVDQVTKLFGAETAKRLILSHMYGVDD